MTTSSLKKSSCEVKQPVEENAKDMIKRVFVVAELIAKAKNEREVFQLSEVLADKTTQETKPLVS
jgi:hypothetical protein